MMYSMCIYTHTVAYTKGIQYQSFENNVSRILSKPHRKRTPKKTSQNRRRRRRRKEKKYTKNGKWKTEKRRPEEPKLQIKL